MKKCPNCGVSNKDESRFCRKCGIQLVENKKIKSNSSSNKYVIIGVVIAILIIATSAYAITTTITNDNQIPKANQNPPIQVNDTNNSIENIDNLNKTQMNETNITQKESNTNQTNNNTLNTTNHTSTKERTKISGIIFTIPDGYWEDDFNTTTIEGDDESTTITAAGKLYKNKAGDTISIIVTSIANGDSFNEDHIKQYAEESGYDADPMTINDIDGYYYIDDLEEPIWYDFVYLKNGKIVCIAVSDEPQLNEVVH